MFLNTKLWGTASCLQARHRSSCAVAFENAFADHQLSCRQFSAHIGTCVGGMYWCPSLRLSAKLITQNLFHKTHTPKFALDIRWGTPELKRAIAGPLFERFIGVIVRTCHYVQARCLSMHCSVCRGLPCCFVRVSSLKLSAIHAPACCLTGLCRHPVHPFYHAAELASSWTTSSDRFCEAPEERHVFCSRSAATFGQYDPM